MNELKYHLWFHKFMINFALWAYALLVVLHGVREIGSAVEDGASNLTAIIVFAVLLILTGLFAILVRFDLAAFRARAPRELLLLCLVTAGILVVLHFLVDIDGGDEAMQRMIMAAILALWGVALYRYYRPRAYLFKD